LTAATGMTDVTRGMKSEYLSSTVTDVNGCLVIQYLAILKIYRCRDGMDSTERTTEQDHPSLIGHGRRNRLEHP
jgi:hypothetical protein